MTRIAFATCLEMPALQPDDAPIAAAIEASGVEVVAAPWNGPFAPFEQCDLVAVRSTWDYAQTPDAFLAWLDRLEGVAARVVNRPSLMRWNARKTYLLDLAERGAPLAPTRLVSPAAEQIDAAMAELGLDEAVVKPVFGAGASGLSIVRRDDPAGLAAAAGRLGCDGLVQPLVPEIRTVGEASLTFVGDTFSHAAIKRARQGSILIHAEHGGTTAPFEPTADHLQVARDVLRLLPEPADYARIDLVPTERGAILMEVELIEPELFVLHGDGAPQRFADFLTTLLPTA
ncbi:MAG: RimK family alpha-L-glutamate ligase [Planctomycetota bacterium]